MEEERKKCQGKLPPPSVSAFLLTSHGLKLWVQSMNFKAMPYNSLSVQLSLLVAKEKFNPWSQRGIKLSKSVSLPHATISFSLLFLNFLLFQSTDFYTGI